MPIDRTRGILFVHVPKTGGTAIETALGLRGDWRIEDRARLFGLIAAPDLIAMRFGSAFLQHLTRAEIARLPGAATGLFSFAVVRNPWDRLVSLHHRIDPHLIDQARAEGIVLTGLAFAEFVPRVLAVRHAHTVPQADYVTIDGHVAVDRLLRHETLAADFAALAPRLGIDPALPTVHAGRTRRHADWRDYYPDALRREVGRVYAQDCETFGYRFG